jgi:hypothetical protein
VDRTLSYDKNDKPTKCPTANILKKNKDPFSIQVEKFIDSKLFKFVSEERRKIEGSKTQETDLTYDA